MMVDKTRMINEGLNRQFLLENQGIEILPNEECRKLGIPQSPIEYILKTWLNRAGISVVCQKKIGDFYIDIFIEDANLIVECDGQGFHDDKEKDDRRDSVLAEMGYFILRFCGAEIYNNSFECVSVVASHLPSLPSGLPEKYDLDQHQEFEDEYSEYND